MKRNLFSSKYYLIGKGQTLVLYVTGVITAHYQCDQMVGLFFNIWPFATVKINPIM